MYWGTRIIRQKNYFSFVSDNVLGPVCLHSFVGGNKNEVSLRCGLDYIAIGNFLVPSE
jgi:hypothetical protein